MLKKKYYIALSFLLLAFLAVAQPRSFSQKPEVFIEEFNAYINSDNTKEGQAIMKSFTTKWDSAKFVEPEQRNIINIANAMLNNDLRIASFVLVTESFFDISPFIGSLFLRGFVCNKTSEFFLAVLLVVRGTTAAAGIIISRPVLISRSGPSPFQVANEFTDTLYSRAKE